jgi:hypothetical protein
MTSQATARIMFCSPQSFMHLSSSVLGPESGVMMDVGFLRVHHGRGRNQLVGGPDRGRFSVGG